MTGYLLVLGLGMALGWEAKRTQLRSVYSLYKRLRRKLRGR